MRVCVCVGVMDPGDLRPLKPQHVPLVCTWLTAGAKTLMRRTGKLYHEVRLGEDYPCGQYTQLGWLTENYVAGDEDGMGVGNNSEGWAVDGMSHEFWHNGSAGPARWPRDWQSGDVIGFALDFQNGYMKFALNGEWNIDLERQFAANGRALFPALSICGTFEIFVSKGDWQHNPPDYEYEAWSSNGTLKRPGVFRSIDARDFCSHTYCTYLVKALYKTTSGRVPDEWYPAVVVGRNVDGTYQVVFQNEAYRWDAPQEHIRISNMVLPSVWPRICLPQLVKAQYLTASGRVTGNWYPAIVNGENSDGTRQLIFTGDYYWWAAPQARIREVDMLVGSGVAQTWPDSQIVSIVFGNAGVPSIIRFMIAQCRPSLALGLGSQLPEAMRLARRSFACAAKVGLVRSLLSSQCFCDDGMSTACTELCQFCGGCVECSRNLKRLPCNCVRSYTPGCPHVSQFVDLESSLLQPDI